MEPEQHDSIPNIKAAVVVAAGWDDGEVYGHETIPFPAGLERRWREDGDEIRLVCGSEVVAVISRMDVEYADRWQWTSVVDTPGSGAYFTHTFQAQMDCIGWLEKMFTHEVRSYRHQQGIPEPERPSRAERMAELRSVGETVREKREAREAAEIAAGTRYRPTPEPWTPRHRSVGSDEKSDSIGGLGWEIEGPPEAPMRGQFGRAADAHFVGATWTMYNALAEIATSAPALEAGIAKAAMAKAMPLIPLDELIEEAFRTHCGVAPANGDSGG